MLALPLLGEILETGLGFGDGGCGVDRAWSGVDLSGVTSLSEGSAEVGITIDGTASSVDGRARLRELERENFELRAETAFQ